MTECLLCPEKAYDKTSLCLSCTENPASIQYFCEQNANFRVMLTIGEDIRLFRAHYANAGQLNPGDYIIYISKSTNNLLIGRICQRQDELEEYIRVVRIPRSFGFRDETVIDNIKFNEIPCVLIPI